MSNFFINISFYTELCMAMILQFKHWAYSSGLPISMQEGFFLILVFPINHLYNSQSTYRFTSLSMIMTFLILVNNNKIHAHMFFPQTKKRYDCQPFYVWLSTFAPLTLYKTKGDKWDTIRYLNSSWNLYTYQMKWGVFETFANAIYYKFYIWN